MTENLLASALGSVLAGFLLPLAVLTFCYRMGRRVERDEQARRTRTYLAARARCARAPLGRTGDVEVIRDFELQLWGEVRTSLPNLLAARPLRVAP